MGREMENTSVRMIRRVTIITPSYPIRELPEHTIAGFVLEYPHAIIETRDIKTGKRISREKVRLNDEQLKLFLKLVDGLPPYGR